MSDEQPANSEDKIDLVGTKVDTVAAKLDLLISGPVRALLDGQARLETEVGALKTDVGSLKAGLAETRTEMRVLHEATKDDIKLVADNVIALRGEMHHGFEAVRKELADSIGPLSDAVTHHSRILKDHERRIGAIEEP